MAKYNNSRKHSRSSRHGHKNTNDSSHPRLRSRDNSKANKSHHSHSGHKKSQSGNKRRSGSRKHGRDHKKNKNNDNNNNETHNVTVSVPYITGTNTPTLNAKNDAILNQAFDNLPPLNIQQQQQQQNKRRKSIDRDNDDNDDIKKESVNPLTIHSDLPPFSMTPTTTRQNRSASAVFTPSQMQATYSFRTIQEEPDDLPTDSPRFIAHHSTPIFQAQQPSNMYIPDEIHLESQDNMTPELPPHQQQPSPLMNPANLPQFNQGHFKSDNAWTQYVSNNNNGNSGQRSSLPGQEPLNMLKSRYNQHEQRSSLPPKESKHMQASSEVNIAIPSFSFAKAPQNKPVHYGSLQNIHEQQKSQTIQYPQTAPQLDHWIDVNNNNNQPQQPIIHQNQNHHRPSSG